MTTYLEDEDLTPGIRAVLERVEPNPRKYIDIGKGWWNVVAALNWRLSELNPDYRLLQVKEKFGGLRYYYTTNAETGPTFRVLVSEVEDICWRTCEVCGKPGVVRDRAWVRVLCDGDADGAPPWPKDRFPTAFRMVSSGD